MKRPECPRRQKPPRAAPPNTGRHKRILKHGLVHAARYRKRTHQQSSDNARQPQIKKQKQHLLLIGVERVSRPCIGKRAAELRPCPEVAAAVQRAALRRPASPQPEQNFFRTCHKVQSSFICASLGSRFKKQFHEPAAFGLDVHCVQIWVRQVASHCTP